MNILVIIVRFMAGIALGFLFYGGLWFTVRQLPVSRHPAWLTFGSFWLRSAIVVTGLLIVMNQHWEYALVCLAGFTAGRLAVSKIMPVSKILPSTGRAS